MTPETYVIGAIVLVAVILVGILYRSSPKESDWFQFEYPLRCPRCGAEMETVGGGGWEYIKRIVTHVVPEVLKLQCPQCGYLQIPGSRRFAKSSLKE